MKIVVESAQRSTFKYLFQQPTATAMATTTRAVVFDKFSLINKFKVFISLSFFSMCAVQLVNIQRFRAIYEITNEHAIDWQPEIYTKKWKMEERRSEAAEWKKKKTLHFWFIFTRGILLFAFVGICCRRRRRRRRINVCVSVGVR